MGFPEGGGGEGGGGSGMGSPDATVIVKRKRGRKRIIRDPLEESNKKKAGEAIVSSEDYRAMFCFLYLSFCLVLFGRRTEMHDDFIVMSIIDPYFFFA